MKKIIGSLVVLFSMSAQAQFQVEFIPAANSVGAEEVSSIPAAKISDFNQAVNLALPTGMVMSFPGTTCPDGWLQADGTAVSRTTKLKLFQVISTNYGTGNGSTTFNLPDYRGRFLRGFDGGTGRDPNASSRFAMNTGAVTGNVIGSVQNDAIQNITGTWKGGFRGGNQIAHGSSSGALGASDNASAEQYGAGGAASAASSITFDASRVVRTSSETRPVNVTVLYCIKD